MGLALALVKRMHPYEPFCDGKSVEIPSFTGTHDHHRNH